MIRSELFTETYPNGDLQRVQVLRMDDWGALRFFRGAPDPAALHGYARIYRRFLIPACPWIFGQMLMFRLPDGLEQLLPGNGGSEPLLTAAEVLRRGVTLRGGRPVFRSRDVQALYAALEKADCIEIICGKLPFTRVIPVSSSGFLLNKNAETAQMRVNASFFILDPFDCATRYDTVGTPFGLAVQEGEILSPPLYGREALTVYRDGSVRVETPSLESLTVHLGGRMLHPGRNTELFTRPGRRKTPRGSGWDHVIIGRKLVDLVPAGGCEIPASGFVLRAAEKLAAPGEAVTYGGMEDVLFAVQAGNSLLRDGVKTDHFVSTFYNIRRPWHIPYPPSLYPLDYDKARAARIALGADEDGKPLLLWAEGAAKIGYRQGVDSCGASLSEFARLCEKAGMVNGVNLDGGGSAQILLRGSRALRISDRDESGAETERMIPLGLTVK